MTGRQKSDRLWKEITLALVLKGAALFVIWSVWFSSPEERVIDDQQAASMILSPQSQKEHDHDAVPGTR